MKISIENDTYNLLVEVALSADLSCTLPEETDIDEWVVCGKCRGCQLRQKLKATGLKEFEHKW